jgi:hypothetical protein
MVLWPHIVSVTLDRSTKAAAEVKETQLRFANLNAEMSRSLLRSQVRKLSRSEPP